MRKMNSCNSKNKMRTDKKNTFNKIGYIANKNIRVQLFHRVISYL